MTRLRRSVLARGTILLTASAWLSACVHSVTVQPPYAQTLERHARVTVTLRDSSTVTLLSPRVEDGFVVGGSVDDARQERRVSLEDVVGIEGRRTHEAGTALFFAGAAFAMVAILAAPSMEFGSIAF